MIDRDVVITESARQKEIRNGVVIITILTIVFMSAYS